MPPRGSWQKALPFPGQKPGEHWSQLTVGANGEGVRVAGGTGAAALQTWGKTRLRPGRPEDVGTGCSALLWRPAGCDTGCPRGGEKQGNSRRPCGLVRSRDQRP